MGSNIEDLGRLDYLMVEKQELINDSKVYQQEEFLQTVQSSKELAAAIMLCSGIRLVEKEHQERLTAQDPLPPKRSFDIKKNSRVTYNPYMRGGSAITNVYVQDAPSIGFHMDDQAILKLFEEAGIKLLNRDGDFL